MKITHNALSLISGNLILNKSINTENNSSIANYTNGLTIYNNSLETYDSILNIIDDKHNGKEKIEMVSSMIIHYMLVKHHKKLKIVSYLFLLALENMNLIETIAG